MKIGFTGTGGTGKTTTLEELISMGLDLPILKSPTKSVFDKWGIGTNEAAQEDMSEEDKYRLQMDILATRAAEEAKEEYSGGFISDRTVLDHYAYGLHRCYLSISDDEFVKMKSATLDNLRTYDKIFYFPIVFVPEYGMRQASEPYRAIIDSIIYSTGERHGLITRVPDGTARERAMWIMEALEKI